MMQPIRDPLPTPIPSRPRSRSFLSTRAGSNGITTDPFKFWVTPNYRQYPMDAVPTKALLISPPAPSTAQDFYWPSDFTGYVQYKIGHTGDDATVCEMTMSGRTGPSIEIIYSANPISSAFWIRARINGDDTNTNYVYFYVYDENGYLVNWSSDTSAPFCIFGGGCTSRNPYTQTWRQGSANAGIIDERFLHAGGADAQQRRAQEIQCGGGYFLHWCQHPDPDTHPHHHAYTHR